MWSSGSAPAAQRDVQHQDQALTGCEEQGQVPSHLGSAEAGDRARKASSSEQMKSSKLLMQYHQFHQLCWGWIWPKETAGGQHMKKSDPGDQRAELHKPDEAVHTQEQPHSSTTAHLLQHCSVLRLKP